MVGRVSGAWMKRWALTGGLACGKSVAAGFFAESGIPVWDADVAAHALMAPGGGVYPAVVARFGRSVLKEDGSLDRKKLGAIVFSDRSALEDLNRLVHPAVLEEMERWFRSLSGEPSAALAVIPLLYEAGLDKGWDAVLAVVTPAERQWRWLLSRGLTPAEAKARLAAQWPEREKMSRADVVLFNGGSLDCLRAQVAAFLKQAGERK